MTPWLPAPLTKTPEEGHDPAVKTASAAVRMTQPDAGALIVASHVGTTHVATVAAANRSWRDDR